MLRKLITPIKSKPMFFLLWPNQVNQFKEMGGKVIEDKGTYLIGYNGTKCKNKRLKLAATFALKPKV